MDLLVDRLVHAAKAIVEYNNDTAGCLCKGCELVNELRDAAESLSRKTLIDYACEAEERFGLDELEDYARKWRRHQGHE